MRIGSSVQCFFIPDGQKPQIKLINICKKIISIDELLFLLFWGIFFFAPLVLTCGFSLASRWCIFLYALGYATYESLYQQYWTLD